MRFKKNDVKFRLLIGQPRDTLDSGFIMLGETIVTSLRHQQFRELQDTTNTNEEGNLGLVAAIAAAGTVAFCSFILLLMYVARACKRKKYKKSVVKPAGGPRHLGNTIASNQTKTTMNSNPISVLGGQTVQSMPKAGNDNTITVRVRLPSDMSSLASNRKITQASLVRRVKESVQSYVESTDSNASVAQTNKSGGSSFPGTTVDKSRLKKTKKKKKKRSKNERFSAARFDKTYSPSLLTRTKPKIKPPPGRLPRASGMMQETETIPRSSFPVRPSGGGSMVSFETFRSQVTGGEFDGPGARDTPNIEF